MDYPDDVFHTFLGLDSVNCLAVNGAVTSLPVFIKYLKLCSEDEQSFYGFGKTWGKVIYDKIFILGWSNPLKFE